MNALPREIAEKVPELRSLCAKYGVKRLTLFGSAVKGTFGRSIDLLVESALTNPYLREAIEREHVDLYAA